MGFDRAIFQGRLMNKKRIILDITMTLLSIILMGGNHLFSADIVHEIFGAGLIVLWAVHVVLNRKWYGAMFCGKYNAWRIMQTFINCCILLCAALLMISGIILSNHIFAFLNIQAGLGFARIAHLLASHWYYLFMSLHIGLHVGMIANKVRHSTSDGQTVIFSKIIFCIFLTVICLYGLYAFIARGVWKYLILHQQFFFFDFERGYFLFAIDYISIIILFATLSHLMAEKLKKVR